MIDWTEVITTLCTVIITGVIAPVAINFYKTKIAKDKQESVEYWVEVGVRWAKQWLRTEEGQAKKSAVMAYVSGKMNELKINVSAEDIDKIIEAVYEQIKSETADIVERHEIK